MAKKPFALPERAKDVNRIWNYLKHRGISRETFVYCVNQGILYESLPYHNAVFVGRDEKDKPGMLSFGESMTGGNPLRWNSQEVIKHTVLCSTKWEVLQSGGI